CKIVFNTNGDYLKSLEDIIMCDELTIMDYDSKGDSALVSKMTSLGVNDIEITKNGIYGNYKHMKVCYHNFWNDVVYGNRGGAIDVNNVQTRTYSCNEPSHFIAIDYNVNVMPCCNLRSDFCKHEKYVLGNLNKDKMKDIVLSDFRRQFLKDTMDEYKIGLHDVCAYCTNKGGRYTRECPSIRY
ncbi:MAG: SPASM domain-containing protein, partial [Anaeroplasmataceae bacterium]